MLILNIKLKVLKVKVIRAQNRIKICPGMKATAAALNNREEAKSQLKRHSDPLIN